MFFKWAPNGNLEIERNLHLPYIRKSRLTLYLQLATCPCTHQKSPWRKMWNTFAEKTSFSRLISRLQRFFFVHKDFLTVWRWGIIEITTSITTTQYAYVLHSRKCKDVPISFWCVWWRTLCFFLLHFIGISKKSMIKTCCTTRYHTILCKSTRCCAIKILLSRVYVAS